MSETNRKNTISKYIPRKVVILAFQHADAQDIVGPCKVFAAANAVVPSGEVLYEVEIVSLEEGLNLPTLSGITLQAHRHWQDCVENIDTLLVSGGNSEAILANQEQLDWLRDTASCARRVGSICTGAFVLAAAGLLNGRRAVTHWRFCDQLAQHYPQIKVDPNPTSIRDGNIYTSAGATAGMDLAIALLEEDAGRKLALRVARELVIFPSRPGGQTQFSTLPSIHQEEKTLLTELRSWIIEHLSSDLSVECLAEHVRMSPRNFYRVFLREAGKPPARFVEQLRVESARRWLEETKASLDRIARECGFGSADSMRRSFLRVLNVVPQDYRNRFQS